MIETLVVNIIGGLVAAAIVGMVKHVWRARH